MENIFHGEIAQPGLGGFYGADGALKILIHALAVALGHFAVGAAVGHIKHIAGKQDQKIAFDLQRADHALIKGGQCAFVLQAAAAQGHQKAMLVTVGHLLGGKADIQQIFAQPAAEASLEQGQIFFALGFGQQHGILLKAGKDLFLFVYITAQNARNVVFAGPQAAAQLADLFGVHKVKLSFL